MLLILFMVFLELGAARGIVALLGYNEIIGLSTFATSLLTLMVIAAGTDYAIFASAATRRPGARAKTGKPRTSRCSAAPLTSCSAPA